MTCPLLLAIWCASWLARFGFFRITGQFGQFDDNNKKTGDHNDEKPQAGRPNKGECVAQQRNVILYDRFYIVIGHRLGVVDFVGVASRGIGIQGSDVVDRHHPVGHVLVPGTVRDDIALPDLGVLGPFADHHRTRGNAGRHTAGLHDIERIVSNIDFVLAS